MQQIEHAYEVFHEVADLPEPQRSEVLRQRCGDDRPLRERVIALLRADDAEATMPRGDGETSWPFASDSDPTPEVPERIGHYRLQRVIASGGMGTVYEAIQQQPRRRVAIKLMRPGVASPSFLRRFEFESEALARLRHPNIAQVFEAGTHDEGRGGVPFFAMEYVPDARSITEFADARDLDTPARLELFIKVCEAVHHGHQKGIIHRDLKPGNILADAEGEPKIIDFGVARATDSDMTLTTQQTDVGQLIGTLQYMSPEQCRADPQDLDTRSDVYALGVVLFELLCGQPPYDLHRVTIYDAARIIREQPPLRPSAVVRTLRGDLETIVLKTLEKERERRYQSAAALADDLRRYLGDDPVMARPPSVVYQLTKFARRNRIVVGAAAAVLLALLVGAVGTVTALGRALAAESEATERAAVAEASQGFLIGTLEGIDTEKRGPQTTVVEMLEAGEPLIDEGFAEQPAVRRELHETFARAFRVLNRYDRSEAHYRDALELAGPDDADRAALLYGLGAALMEGYRYEEAGEVLSAARALVELAEVPNALVAEVEKGWAFHLHNLGAYEMTELHYREALRRFRLISEESLDVAICLDLLGRLAVDRGDLERGEELIRAGLDMKREHGRDPGAALAFSFLTLGYLEHASGEWRASADAYRTGRDMYLELHGDPSVFVVAMSRMTLAGLLEDVPPSGPRVGAIDSERSFDFAELGGGKGVAAVNLRNQGRLLHRQGRHTLGDERFAAAIEIHHEVDSADGSLTEAHTRRVWAELLHEAGRIEESREHYERALEMQRAELRGELRIALAATLLGLGRLHLDAGDTTRGDALVAEARVIRRAYLDETRH